MRCILDARERWLKAEGNRHVERASDSGPSSARRLSELSHRAKGLWSTDHRCAALTANVRANDVGGASSRRSSPPHHGDGRRLKEGFLSGRNFSKDSASLSPSCAGVPNWCIDGQDTNITAALMASVASGACCCSDLVYIGHWSSHEQSVRSESDFIDAAVKCDGELFVV